MAKLGKHQSGAILLILMAIFSSSEVSAASNFTKPYETALLIEVIISVILLGVVIGLLVIFIRNNKTGASGENKKIIQNEKKFEMLWTLGATVIVMGLFFALIGPTSDIYNPKFSSDTAETIRVTGLPEFTWEFTFENGTSFKANNATYDYTIPNPNTHVPYAALRLKANIPYHLEITAAEDAGAPIHSFFVTPHNRYEIH